MSNDVQRKTSRFKVTIFCETGERNDPETYIIEIDNVWHIEGRPITIRLALLHPKFKKLLKTYRDSYLHIEACEPTRHNKSRLILPKHLRDTMIP